MSQRPNAPYHDRVYEDGITIEYEGHDVPRKSYTHNPKAEDQPDKLPSGGPPRLAHWFGGGGIGVSAETMPFQASGSILDPKGIQTPLRPG